MDNAEILLCATRKLIEIDKHQDIIKEVVNREMKEIGKLYVEALFFIKKAIDECDGRNSQKS